MGHGNCINVFFPSSTKRNTVHCVSQGVESCLSVYVRERETEMFNREAPALWLSVTIHKWNDVNGNVISGAKAIVFYAPSTVPEHAPSTHHQILCCHGVPVDIVQLHQTFFRIHSIPKGTILPKMSFKHFPLYS